MQPPPDDFVALLVANSFSVVMQYAVSRDRAAFAARYHPLLPAALLRRIESSDPSLTSLEIKGNPWSSDGSSFLGCRRVVGLAEALSLNTCITSLVLSGHKLGGEGLQALIGAVTQLTALTSLDLGSNDMMAEGAEAMAVIVTRLTSLRSLSVANNKVGSLGLT